jgi:ribosome-associated heat shock protein Hsp15
MGRFPVPGSIDPRMPIPDPMHNPLEIRIDKWLWAARFFKTRALAVDAITGGKVEVNGVKAKPARHVRPGDEVRVRLGPYEHRVTVRAVSEHRGPAKDAALLYEEDPAGRTARERLQEQHRCAAVAFAHGEGRPSKKERRAIRALKGRD